MKRKWRDCVESAHGVPSSLARCRQPQCHHPSKSSLVQPNRDDQVPEAYEKYWPKFDAMITQFTQDSALKKLAIARGAPVVDLEAASWREQKEVTKAFRRCASGLLTKASSIWHSAKQIGPSCANGNAQVSHEDWPKLNRTIRSIVRNSAFKKLAASYNATNDEIDNSSQIDNTEVAEAFHRCATRLLVLHSKATGGVASPPWRPDCWLSQHNGKTGMQFWTRVRKVRQNQDSTWRVEFKDNRITDNVPEDKLAAFTKKHRLEELPAVGSVDEMKMMLGCLFSMKEDARGHAALRVSDVQHQIMKHFAHKIDPTSFGHKSMTGLLRDFRFKNDFTVVDEGWPHGLLLCKVRSGLPSHMICRVYSSHI